MSLEFVLDCSVTMAWFFDDEASEVTDELLDVLNRDGRAVVAAHWALEVGNTLIMAGRRKRTHVADSSHFLAILDAMPIETDLETTVKAHSATLALARTHGLTLYDSAYLYGAPDVRGTGTVPAHRASCCTTVFATLPRC